MLHPGLLVLLGSLLGGWWCSRSFTADLTVRALLAVVLGPATVTALVSLLAITLPTSYAWVVALLITLLGPGLYLRRVKDSSGYGARPRRGEFVLLAILSLAAWLYACGSQQLFPSENYLLWQLPRAEGVGKIVAGSGFLPVSGLFGSDPWAATLTGLAVLQVVVVVGVYLACYLHLPGGILPRLTGSLYLLLSTRDALLLFGTPEEVLLNLWTVAALVVALTSGPARFLGGLFALAAAPLSWAAAVAVLMVLVPWRGRAFKAMVVAGAFYAVGFQGFTLPLLPALFVLLTATRAPSSQERNLVILLSVLQLWGSGRAVFGVTAGGLLLAGWLKRKWDEAPRALRPAFRDGELLFPQRWLVGVALAGVLFFGVDKGETVLNDQVLIGSHKEDVELARLFLPHTLAGWLEWRGPRLGFGPEERMAVEDMKKLQGRVVYLSGAPPDPVISSLAATLAGKPLVGWRRVPSGAALAAHLDAFLASGEPAVLAGSDLDWLVRPDTGPVQVPTEGSPGPPSSDPLKAELSGGGGKALPANSLIPLRVRLTNTAGYRVVHENTAGARFRLKYLSGVPLRPVTPPLTPLALPAMEPDEEVEVTVYLRTPPRPATFELELQLVGDRGFADTVPLGENAAFRTWSPDPPREVPGGVRRKP